MSPCSCVARYYIKYTWHTNFVFVGIYSVLLFSYESSGMASPGLDPLPSPRGPPSGVGHSPRDGPSELSCPLATRWPRADFAPNALPLRSALRKWLYSLQFARLSFLSLVRATTLRWPALGRLERWPSPLQCRFDAKCVSADTQAFCLLRLPGIFPLCVCE